MNEPNNVKDRRLKNFNGGLLPIYQNFDDEKLPNRALFEHLLRFWFPLAIEHPDFHDRDLFGEKPTIFGGCSDSRTGLLLHGKSRSGKTQTACELGRRFISGENDTRFLSMVEWAAETSEKAKDCRLKGWAEETLAFWWKCEFGCLILDDLDKARFTDVVQSQLFNLIEQATGNNITLIVTTNCTADKLLSKFDDNVGPPIVARLREFCKPINMAAKLSASTKAAAAAESNILPMEVTA